MTATSRTTCLRFALCATLCLMHVAVRAADDAEFFEKRIRPLLAERCQSCHSAASGKTSGGLALDTRDGWVKGGDSGSPIVPGKPDESLLVSAVRYDSGGPQMPPDDAGGKLADAEIAALTQWVARGAPDTRTVAASSVRMTPDEARHWWSFQPVRPSDPPAVQNTAWPLGPIDQFVLAEIEKHGLHVSPAADRRTLLRRATFDLTGLPPTPAEVEAFLKDDSPEAFARVVDRLLASPAYGQRWARHWLDVARYADYYDANPQTRTASCELTEAWRYRDWVVDALNHDLPFDQFVEQQIAGDLLPNPSGEEVYPAGLVATTFLSNGVWDRGDADKEKIISDMADDNIDIVGKAFLGLTLGCARCHDHKFDPITTEDYYALAGMFYSSHILKDLGAKGAEYVMNRVPLVPAAVVEKRQQHEQQLAAANQRIEAFDRRQRYLDLIAGGKVLAPKEFRTESGATGAIAADGSITIAGTLAKDTYTLTADLPAGTECKIIRLEALADPSLPAQGPGRSADGAFMVTDFAVAYTLPGAAGTPVSIKLASATADFEQTGMPVTNSIDMNPESGWAIGPAFGQDHVATFEVAAESPIPAGAQLTITIAQRHEATRTLGKLRLSVTTARVADSSTAAARQELVTVRDKLQQEMPPPIPLAIATTEGGTAGGLFPAIQDVPIHIRGSYARLGPVVPRRMPKILAGENQSPIASGSGRRELAHFVASKDNPLTARVIVNRLWQWHFGEGLVRTPSNFGKLGDRPTHPELLDYLAAQLVADNWSLKRLHRQIMLSATYQQDSRAPADQVEADPENRWLARFSPRHLEAESVRDAMLAVSGRLDSTAGGPAGDDFTIERRSLYVQTARWDRSSYAMLFDAANPDSSTEKRTVSVVAPQALLLLNHDFVQTQARFLAERVARESTGDAAARIQHVYQLLFARPATDRELEIARQLVDGAASADQDAAWVDLAHVLLCSNEFMFID